MTALTTAAVIAVVIAVGFWTSGRHNPDYRDRRTEAAFRRSRRSLARVTARREATDGR